MGDKAPRRAARGHFGVEVDLGYGSGGDDQKIGFNDFVQLGGTEFNGPATLDLDWTLFAGSIAVRGGGRVEDIYVLEAIGGLGFNRVRLEVESGSLSASESFLSIGPMIGLQAGVEPLPWLAAHARGMWTGGLGPEVTSLGAAELALVLKPGGRVLAFGGWRWWDYRAEGESGDSDVELDLSGPMLGVELRF